MYGFRKILSMIFILLYSIISIASTKTNNTTIEKLKLFGDIFEKVQNNYVEKVSEEDLIEYAINGMLSGLDPHSGFLNSKNLKEIEAHTKGEFNGIGMEVTINNGFLMVVSPIDNTPAFNAGIKHGDYITAIDGKSTIGLNLTEAVEIMKGSPDTQIILSIINKDLKEPIDITIKRDVIKIIPVKSELYGDILYLRISSFTEKTTESIKNELKKHNAKGKNSKIKGLLIDLRNNPGGLLEQAISVSDLFLPEGEIVSTRGMKKDNTKRFNASGEVEINKIPIVILINGGTASASEIVAGALQDHKIAIIVGTKSFGKGSVQSIIPFQHNTAIRLTTAKYYTPSGRSIQAEGIVPDITIEKAEIKFVKNKTYTEVDLPKYLQNKQTKKTMNKKNNEQKKEMYEKDYQLGFAYDILQSTITYSQQIN